VSKGDEEWQALLHKAREELESLRAQRERILKALDEEDETLRAQREEWYADPGFGVWRSFIPRYFIRFTLFHRRWQRFEETSEQAYDQFAALTAKSDSIFDSCGF
jgi:hypothetical protein